MSNQSCSMIRQENLTFFASVTNINRTHALLLIIPSTIGSPANNYPWIRQNITHQWMYQWTMPSTRCRQWTMKLQPRQWSMSGLARAEPRNAGMGLGNSWDLVGLGGWFQSVSMGLLISMFNMFQHVSSISFWDGADLCIVSGNVVHRTASLSQP